ncbi:MAG: 50S ribosome-binding GTPase [Proteobacteria bacterium]|nr:50S ribosome-binding GTPase [Pseudomonadota bacterium]
MYTRTYRARGFDAALAEVKRDLGPDAVILSSRKLPDLAKGRGQAWVEVKAMPDGALSELGARPEQLQRRWVDGDTLAEDLQRARVPSVAAKNLSHHVRRLAGGSSQALAQVRAELTQALAALLRFAGPIGGDASRVVALVGPTGVGKTTTIAKLAAQAALVERRTVGLVSIDQYRLGGDEQLGRYADLIGIPMLVAEDSKSLARALQQLKSAELVLVDTAGRSPQDREELLRMATCFEQVSEGIDVHLCLAAATRSMEADAIIDRMSVFHPRRLITTKLDEAVAHGCIVGAQQSSSLPLSYFTTGQRVPEDIELASPERLAELLCRGGMH